MTFDELKDKAHALPLKPGVYIMMDKTGKVIYVGKAKALKNRVSQYFQDSSAHTEKTRNMVSHIDHFDVILAQSEFEALVLECSLIKRHQPHYNILLKDDKGYPYIRLSSGPYPKFSLATRAGADEAKYFGPYGSRGRSQDIIDALLAALKLPSCARKFPRDIGKERPCLNYHMGLCDGYCRPDMDQSRYGEAIAQAVRLLDGKYDEVVEDLKAEMEQAAGELRFEKAAELRDRIRAIEMLGTRQKVLADSLADTDVVGFYRGEAKSCFVVLHYVDGELAAKDWELIETPVEDESEAVSSLAAQFYGGRSRLPRQILLPCDIEDEPALSRMLTEAGTRKVAIVTPQRGAKMDLVKLANENARGEVERSTTGEERANKLLELLGKTLDLEGPPRRIEAFDISNTGASDIVASMTVFVDGRPRKRDYRHFKIRDLENPDDYQSMAQVLERRFGSYLEGDEKFSELPDLLLIDGGAGQTSAAVRAVESLGLSVPAFGMVKDDRHRTRALVSAGGHEISIRGNQSLFSFIGRIQEETHRFAIEFHRAQRARHVTGSELDGIEGVGPTRRAALLKEFKSIKKVREAGVERLMEAVPKNVAQAVYDYYHAAPERTEKTDGDPRP